MFETIYHPAYNPPAKLFRSNLLFYDKLHIIVPVGVSPNLEPANDAVVQASADVLGIQRQSPGSFTGWPNHLDPLDRVFSQIAGQRGPSKRIEFIISTTGERSCPGHVFLHRYKSDDSVRDLLKKHGLMLDIKSPDPDYDIVETNASGVILSILADNISAANGFHTVTDRPIEHLATVLCAPRQGAAVDVLAASIIQTEIPDRITELTAAQFLELRKRYADIREPFHAAVRELFGMSNLQNVKDAAGFEELVRTVTLQYATEIANLRSAPAMAHVKRWIPFTLSTVVGVGGALSGLLDTGTATTVSLAGAGISTVLEFLDSRPAGYVPARAESQRLLSDLQSDIFRTPVYKKVIEG